MKNRWFGNGAVGGGQGVFAAMAASCSVVRAPMAVAAMFVLSACSTTGGDNGYAVGRQTGDAGLTGDMLTLPAGEFMMGEDHSLQSDERPRHPVRISAFRLAATEVTREQFLRFVKATGYRNDAPCWGWDGHTLATKPSMGWQNPGFSQNAQHPVVCISWLDSRAYIDWLNATLKPAQAYRLPSEAEWEYAVRALGNGRYPSGDHFVEDQFNCWVCREDWEETAPVASFAANRFGLYDMSGNVWEWVQDCYVDHYRNAPVSGSAHEFSNCTSRVVRGGSWADNAGFLRNAYRVPYQPGYRHQTFGFRVAQDL